MGVPHGTIDRVTHGIHTVRMDDVAVVQTYRWKYSPIKMQHVSCTKNEVAIQSAVRTNLNVTRVNTEVTAQLSW